MLEIVAPATMSARADYEILPEQRGDLPIGKLYLRYRSALQLAERWAVADTSATVRVLPNLEQAKQQTLYLIRTRQVAMERRRRRVRGLGREFESLREYRTGDEFRNISWTSTARRSKLITRVFQVERSQTVWIVLDAGRLLREQIVRSGAALRFSKLDYAVDAALALAQVAMHSGDRVGLARLRPGNSAESNCRTRRSSSARDRRVSCFSARRALRSRSRTGGARAAFRTVAPESDRVDHRSPETAGTPDVMEYAVQMKRRHLVLFAAVGQPDLNDRVARRPESEEEMFRYVAAIEIVQRRELLLRRLRQQGVLAMELMPGALAGSLVNQYLDIKDRSLI